MKKLISIVIPAYNEEDVLEELAKRLKVMMQNVSNYDFEIIMVENGSVDSSFEKLMDINKKDPRFKVIQLSRNFGCDGGLIAGLKYAAGHAIVLMNADLQDPPEVIPKFIEKWEKGYEIVYGIIDKRFGVSLSRKVLSSFFYKLIARLTGGLFPKNVSDFRLIDRKVCDAVGRMEERNCFLRGMIVWTGFKQAGISFDRPPRFAGRSKADFLTIFGTALNGIFSFSYLPLRLATLLGLILFVFSLLAGVVYVALYFIYGRIVPGFLSIVTLMLFLFGFLFLILGVIGEYLARVYDEVKRRPNYIIKDKIGLN